MLTFRKQFTNYGSVLTVELAGIEWSSDDSLGRTGILKYNDAMELTIEATYENGILKPDEPLPLAEHAKVRVTVHTARSPLVEAYGMLPWSGDLETLEYLATDPEFDPQEG